MRRVLVGLFIVSVALTGCGGTTSHEGSKGDQVSMGGGAPKPKGPRSVTVRLVKKDHNVNIAYKPTAKVTNDEYADGTFGTVQVTAKTSRNPDKNSHWISARVTLRSGGTVSCGEVRSHVWSDFDVYEDIQFPCDKTMTLSDVTSVVIVP